MSLAIHGKRWSRKTIVLDADLESKLRDLQANMISADGSSYSLSKIINMILYSGFLTSEKLDVDEWNKIYQFVRGRKIGFDSLNTEQYLKFLTSGMSNALL